MVAALMSPLIVKNADPCSRVPPPMIRLQGRYNWSTPQGNNVEIAASNAPQIIKHNVHAGPSEILVCPTDAIRRSCAVLEFRLPTSMIFSARIVRYVFDLVNRICAVHGRNASVLQGTPSLTDDQQLMRRSVALSRSNSASYSTHFIYR